MRAIGEMQSPGDIDSGFGERVQLRHEGRRIHHDPRANHRMLPRPQNAARDQLQHETAPVEDDGVSGVVGPRASRDIIERRCKVVHHLALPFISPLRTHHHDRLHRQIAPA